MSELSDIPKIDIYRRWSNRKQMDISPFERCAENSSLRIHVTQILPE